MRNQLVLSIATLAAVGCGDNTRPQVLTGRIATGFPMPVQMVKLLEGSHVVASAPVGADGSFRLWTMPHRGLTLHLVGTGRNTVVFPRQASGAVDRTFSILGAGVDFDLGNIRYVGTPGPTTFAFHTSGDGACNGDGQDANGADCVDDGNNNDSGSCGNNDGEQQGDNAGNDNNNDGEQQDGSGGSDAGADSQDGQDQGDAVAEHNFPSDGCAGGNDNGGDQQDGESGDQSGD